MFSFHKNVRKKHWDSLLDIMDDLLEIEFKCTKCDKVFTTEKSLREHQRRKRAGKRTGCFVLPGGSGSRSSANTSSMFTLTSALGVPSDLSELDDIGSDIDTNKEDFEKGFDSFGTMGDLSLHQLIKHVKVKHNTVLGGDVFDKPGSQGGSRVELPTISFVHGLVKAVVEKITSHPDFPKNPGETVKEIVDFREARSKIFKGVFVDHSQDNAERKHLCVARECTDTCTFAMRKTLFHQQQTLLALEVAKAGKVLRPHWVELAAQHLRRLKVENTGVFNVFLPHVHTTFSDTNISKYLCDLPHSSSHVADPPTSHPRAIQVVPAGKGLEISTMRVERAEARAKRRRRGNN